MKFPKTLAAIFRSLKCVFPKCTFSGPQLNQLGLVWYILNSSKAHAAGGLDNSLILYLAASLLMTFWRVQKISLDVAPFLCMVSSRKIWDFLSLLTINWDLPMSHCPSFMLTFWSIELFLYQQFILFQHWQNVNITITNGISRLLAKWSIISQYNISRSNPGHQKPLHRVASQLMEPHCIHSKHIQTLSLQCIWSFIIN